jgi:hypothetical protein
MPTIDGSRLVTGELIDTHVPRDWNSNAVWSRDLVEKPPPLILRITHTECFVTTNVDVADEMVGVHAGLV